MRFVKWRGVGLAIALMASMVAGHLAIPKAQAGGLYHWWNGHTINGRATLAKDYRTGGVYYAPPIPYGEYTKNYTGCLHEAAGAIHGLIGKVCGFCRGLGCKVCGYLGCLHGAICGGCNGQGCGNCNGSGLTNGASCNSCGGKGCGTCGGRGFLHGGGHGAGLGGSGAGQQFGHGLDLNRSGHDHRGLAFVGNGPRGNANALLGGAGNGLGDPTCGLCGNGAPGGQGRGTIVAAGKGLPNTTSTLASAQSTTEARACSLCGGQGRIAGGSCGGCGGQGKIFGFVSGAKCGTCGGYGRKGSAICNGCGGAGLLSGLTCGSCGGRGQVSGHACGTCCGRGLLAATTTHGVGNAAGAAAACGACAGSGLINGARCAVCKGTGYLSKAVHHVARSASNAAHHVASTASGLAHSAMMKMGKGGVEYFVGPGGPVPITPGYVNYVVTTRSPRDFFAFPPFVDQAFNSTSYTTPLYQEPARSATVVAPAPIDRVRVNTTVQDRLNTSTAVPAPPLPGGNAREIRGQAINRDVPPPPSVDEDADDNAGR